MDCLTWETLVNTINGVVRKLETDFSSQNLLASINCNYWLYKSTFCLFIYLDFPGTMFALWLMGRLGVGKHTPCWDHSLKKMLLSSWKTSHNWELFQEVLKKCSGTDDSVIDYIECFKRQRNSFFLMANTFLNLANMLDCCRWLITLLK